VFILFINKTIYSHIVLQRSNVFKLINSFTTFTCLYVDKDKTNVYYKVYNFSRFLLLRHTVMVAERDLKWVMYTLK